MRAKEGLWFWGNGSLQTTVDLRQGPVRITVVGRGVRVDGEWPRVDIELGSEPVASLTIDGFTVADHTAVVPAASSGRSVLKLRFTNYVPVPEKPLTSRGLMVERVIVSQP